MKIKTYDISRQTKNARFFLKIPAGSRVVGIDAAYNLYVMETNNDKENKNFYFGQVGVELPPSITTWSIVGIVDGHCLFQW